MPHNPEQQSGRRESRLGGWTVGIAAAAFGLLSVLSGAALEHRNRPEPNCFDPNVVLKPTQHICNPPGADPMVVDRDSGEVLQRLVRVTDPQTDMACFQTTPDSIPEWRICVRSDKPDRYEQAAYLEAAR